MVGSKYVLSSLVPLHQRPFCPGHLNVKRKKCTINMVKDTHPGRKLTFYGKVMHLQPRNVYYY